MPDVSAPRIDAREILGLPLFRGVAADALTTIATHLRVEEHPKDAWLFRQGDSGDVLYVVLSGMVMLENEIEGQRRVVALCGPGEWFGELGILAKAPRTADAIVQVDTRLLRIDQEGWESLAVLAPAIFARLCERLVRQLRATTEAPRRGRRTVVACTGDDGALLVETLAGSLRRQFPARPVHVLQGGGAARTLRDALSAIVELDAIVLLAGAGAAELAERRAARVDATTWRLQPGMGDRPADAIRGRTAEEALDRLARYVAGGTIGVALGAGGAYGYAHVGLLRALEHAGIPIDVVAGTSMGAIVGALCAAGMPVDAMADFAAGSAARYARIVLRDLDLRGPALLRGTEVARILGELPRLAAARFETLDLPFAAIAMDVDSGEEIVLDHGLVLEEIRPSFAMPGIFPPCPRAGRLLIDGAMANPVPVDRARALGADFVIAAQPIPPLTPVDRSQGLLRRMANLVPGIRLGDKLDALDVTIRSFQALWHRHARVAALTADAVITPDLRAFTFLQFGSAAAIIDAGERHARSAVRDLRRQIADRVGLELPS
jgi:predicted acylesterase/phospholipase RssA